MSHRRPRSERGQVVPLLAVGLLLAGVAALGLARIAVASAKTERAQAAADAAALAGAADGRDAAESIAVANGARLVAYEEQGVDVVVTVVWSGVRASARARWGAAPTGGAGP